VTTGWERELDELRRREALARRIGGDEKVAKHHAQGRLTVRERIDALLDPGSFHEIGALTGRASYDDEGNLVDVTPANFVTGRGRVDGRPVVVGGDDFTVRGGAADAAIFQKQVHAERMANELRIPIVRLVDGSGGGGSVNSLERDRRSFVPFNPGWDLVVANLATVPVVSLCLGSVAGLGAARVVTSHYSVMVKGTSQLFVAGPPVVARLGEDVDKEALGGSAIHTRNGTVDDEAPDEYDAFARARRFLSFLPQSVYDVAPRAEPGDEGERVRVVDVEMRAGHPAGGAAEEPRRAPVVRLDAETAVRDGAAHQLEVAFRLGERLRRQHDFLARRLELGADREPVVEPDLVAARAHHFAEIHDVGRARRDLAIELEHRGARPVVEERSEGELHFQGLE